MGLMKSAVVILVLLAVYGIAGHALDEKNEKGMFNLWKYKTIDNCLSYCDTQKFWEKSKRLIYFNKNFTSEFFLTLIHF